MAISRDRRRSSTWRSPDARASMPRGQPGNPPCHTRRLAGEPIARQRRDDDIERVLGGAAVRRWIGKRTDDLELLDHGPWPTVCDEQWECVGMTRADVDEVDVDAVDRRDELRQRI